MSSPYGGIIIYNEWHMNEKVIHQGQVVLFTGPAAAGKTTLAEAWAQHNPHPTACFDQDQARFLLRSGYVSRSAAHADPTLQPEADRQWLLSIAICESFAETYTSWGYDCALSAFRPTGAWNHTWERLDRLRLTVVVLLPSLETLLARDAQRSGRAHVGEASLRRGLCHNWAGWRDDPRAVLLDSSGETVDATLDRVVAALQERGG